MKIEVKRLWENDESICGELYVDNQAECFTLERPRTGDHPCVAAGNYPIQLTFSPHLKYITPELQAVPGREHIRIHIANTASELLGCIAVGETHTLNFVGNSHDAFASLLVLLKTSSSPITITITDPPPINQA